MPGIRGELTGFIFLFGYLFLQFLFWLRVRWFLYTVNLGSRLYVHRVLHQMDRKDWPEWLQVLLPRETQLCCLHQERTGQDHSSLLFPMTRISIFPVYGYLNPKTKPVSTCEERCGAGSLSPTRNLDTKPNYWRADRRSTVLHASSERHWAQLELSIITIMLLLFHYFIDSHSISKIHALHHPNAAFVLCFVALGILEGNAYSLKFSKAKRN